MKKAALIIFLIIFSLAILSKISLAQIDTPTPLLNMANCDACGYCKDGSLPSTWEKCRDCLYPGLKGYSATENKTLEGLPTPDPDHHYTMLGCLSTKPGEFTKQISEFFFVIVGGIAFLFLLYGAGIVATSQSDPEKLNHGKRIIYGAIIGLLFVLFSTFIFNFIATNVLKIPGFGS